MFWAVLCYIAGHLIAGSKKLYFGWTARKSCVFPFLHPHHTGLNRTHSHPLSSTLIYCAEFLEQHLCLRVHKDRSGQSFWDCFPELHFPCRSLCRCFDAMTSSYIFCLLILLAMLKLQGFWHNLLEFARRNTTSVVPRFYFAHYLPMA